MGWSSSQSDAVQKTSLLDIRKSSAPGRREGGDRAALCFVATECLTRSDQRWLGLPAPMDNLRLASSAGRAGSREQAQGGGDEMEKWRKGARDQGPERAALCSSLFEGRSSAKDFCFIYYALQSIRLYSNPPLAAAAVELPDQCSTGRAAEHRCGAARCAAALCWPPYYYIAKLSLYLAPALVSRVSCCRVVSSVTSAARSCHARRDGVDVHVRCARSERSGGTRHAHAFVVRRYVSRWCGGRHRHHTRRAMRLTTTMSDE
jgi:hypothetical protein